MRITREMYSGAADTYTDLLDITARSLGVSPLRGTLADELQDLFANGWRYVEAITVVRLHHERVIATALAVREWKRA